MAVIAEKPTGLVDGSDRSLLKRLLFPYTSEGLPRAPVLFGLLIIAIATPALGLYRWYMEATAFTVGLDYFEPEFQTYWMSWLYGQLTLVAVIGAIGVPWLWLTRPSREEVMAMPARDELGVYVLIFTVMGMLSVLVPTILGLWVEADAAWHQVTIRDTDFTPTHIQLFYGVIPLAAVGLVLGVFWLHTRMPNYIGRVSIPLLMVGAAPLLIMPNLGYNEWGHTFFYAEELFAAPVHWGFVVLGWGLFGVSGFFLECINRILVLTKVKSVKKDVAA
jgi:methane/ammonia monooxygenase subunit C